MAIGTPDSISGPPRWKVIYDQVHSELPRYDYGSRFYTISELCQKFSVSKITAIRVLNELAHRDLIEKLPGKGNVVRHVRPTVSMRILIPAEARRDYLTFDHVIQRLYKGLDQAARQYGIDCSTISETHLQTLFPRPNAMFGFLVLRSVPQTLQFLRAHRLPHVLVDPADGYKGRPHARFDRVGGGYQATRHLLELGHRRIAWITGPISSRNFRDRVRGYRDALHEASLPFRWSLIRETDGFDADRDAEALEELLQLTSPPTAIIAGDDNRAMHILAACSRRGIDVPSQLSVLGYPNNPESSLSDPPLSTVDARYEHVGHAAVKLLLAQILEAADPASQAVTIEPEVVRRSSTGPVPKQRRVSPAKKRQATWSDVQ